MSLTAINKRGSAPPTYFLDSGFRPFFLAAAVYAVIGMFLWSLIYKGQASFSEISPLTWHSHEMIYGYSFAVIAGFLLTAVTNWTNIETLQNGPLLCLLIFWTFARVFFLFGDSLLLPAGLFDLIFNICLFFALLLPIIRSRSWKQSGILTKLALLTAGNFSVYYGLYYAEPQYVAVGTYGGLFLIIGLILTIGSRVIPSFIQIGISSEKPIANPKWAAASSMLTFLCFFLNELFYRNREVLIITTAVLFGITTYRLFLWHARSIWTKPLLWSLYLSIVLIDLGFFLYFAGNFIELSPYLGVHALSAGGIGLATVGMMARVIVGHSGGNVRAPEKYTSASFILILFSVFARVALPIIEPAKYAHWILISQYFWMSGFAFFIFAHRKQLLIPPFR